MEETENTENDVNRQREKRQHSTQTERNEKKRKESEKGNDESKEQYPKRERKKKKHTSRIFANRRCSSSAVGQFPPFTTSAGFIVRSLSRYSSRFLTISSKVKGLLRGGLPEAPAPVSDPSSAAPEDRTEELAQRTEQQSGRRKAGTTRRKKESSNSIKVHLLHQKHLPSFLPFLSTQKGEQDK